MMMNADVQAVYNVQSRFIDFWDNRVIRVRRCMNDPQAVFISVEIDDIVLGFVKIMSDIVDADIVKDFWFWKVYEFRLANYRLKLTTSIYRYQYQLTGKCFTFQVIADNFRSFKAKVVKVIVVDDVRVALKLQQQPASLKRSKKEYLSDNHLERTRKLVRLVPGRYILAVIISTFELVKGVRFEFFRQPNLFDSDIVFKDWITKPSSMLHLKVIVENWFSNHVQLAVLGSIPHSRISFIASQFHFELLTASQVFEERTCIITFQILLRRAVWTWTLRWANIFVALNWWRESRHNWLVTIRQRATEFALSSQTERDFANPHRVLAYAMISSVIAIVDVVNSQWGVEAVTVMISRNLEFSLYISSLSLRVSCMGYDAILWSIVLYNGICTNIISFPIKQWLRKSFRLRKKKK